MSYSLKGCHFLVFKAKLLTRWKLLETVTLLSVVLPKRELTMQFGCVALPGTVLSNSAVSAEIWSRL